VIIVGAALPRVCNFFVTRPASSSTDSNGSDPIIAATNGRWLLESARQFDRRLKPKFLGGKVTADAGLVADRELDETLGLTEIGEEVLAGSRLGGNGVL
jgi:hypothetical protein